MNSVSNNTKSDQVSKQNSLNKSMDEHLGSTSNNVLTQQPMRLCDVSIPDNDDFSDIEPIVSEFHPARIYRLGQSGIEYSPVIDPNITILSESEIGYLIWSFKVWRSDVVISGIYHDGILKLLFNLGVYRRIRENSRGYQYIREQDNKLEQVDIAYVKKLIKDYIDTLDSEIIFSFQGLEIRVQRDKLMEMYLRFAPQKLEDKFLQLLTIHSKPLLGDSGKAAYFFFQNSIQKVTADSIESVSYDTLSDSCIWKDHIIKRPFTYTNEGDKSKYHHFIRNVTNNESDRFDAFKSAIGYLLNNYSSPSETQAIIAYDEEITDTKNPMGGTGKGIKAKSIAELRKVTKIDGKKFNPNDRFKFQDVDATTQVVWLDDISPQVGFETFHSCLTDGWSIEKKYQDSYLIPPDRSPKLLITSNTILQGGGSTNKRRQFVLEFGKHYSSKIRKGNEKPIESEHGGLFFDDNDWDALEWSRFYSFMLDCCQFYHQKGLVAYEVKTVHLNLLRQNTCDEFFEWVLSQSFSDSFRYETKKYYTSYLESAGISKELFGYQKFSDYLKTYATSRNMKFTSFRSNGIQYFKFEKITN